MSALVPVWAPESASALVPVRAPEPVPEPVPVPVPEAGAPCSLRGAVLESVLVGGGCRCGGWWSLS